MDFEISNSHLKIKASLLGAELQSILLTDETSILWQKESTHWNRIAPILFPIVGRLKNDSYHLNNVSYPMTQHGFARDQEFELIEKTDTAIHFRLQSKPETKTKYPFDFEFDTIYSIQDSCLTIEHVVRNLSSEIMPFSVGGHPAFTIKGNLSDYLLEVNDSCTIQQSLLSNGFLKEESINLYWNKELKLDYSLFENDAIVIKNPPFDEIALKHIPTGRIVKMTCENWTALGIWTKKEAPFLCIEPWWGWADEENSTGNLLEKAGIQQLLPNEVKTFSYSISIHEI